MNTQPQHRSAGFTLIEVLIVIVIIGVLAALMFPLVSGFRERARAAVCAQNLKQIGIGLHAYIAENSGRFPDAELEISTPSSMCWFDAAADNMGREFEYKPRREWERLPDAFGCPSGYGKAYLNNIADGTESGGWPYTGDYATNFYLGRSGFQVLTMSAVKQPSSTPYVQDTVWQQKFGPGIYANRKSAQSWKNNPRTAADNRFADRHGGSGNILWVDGHVSSMKYSEYMDFANDSARGGAYNFMRGNW